MDIEGQRRSDNFEDRGRGEGGGGGLGAGALLFLAQRLGLKEVRGDISTTARPFFERMGFRFEKDSSFDVNGVVLTHHTLYREP